MPTPTPAPDHLLGGHYGHIRIIGNTFSHAKSVGDPCGTELDFKSLLGSHKWPQIYRELAIANVSSLLGIHQLGIHSTGNLNSQLGIHKCVKKHHEMATGNFSTQWGCHK